MTISAALNSAVSGLAAAGRASAVVSENIANALTPGYARRSLARTSNSDVAPGVRVTGIVRNDNPVATADRRAADADLSHAQTLADFHARLSTLIGEPGDPASIGMRLADFETSLIEAASLPGSQQRLTTAVASASDLAKAISGAAEGLRQLRNQTDRSIGEEVATLNHKLAEVQKLNVRITSANANGGETAALMDQRQVAVDAINQIVPVRVFARDHGKIALYSEGGAILLDGAAATIGFTAVNETMPHMTVGNGLLSGLTINDIPVSTGGANAALHGGSLEARFQVRDDLSTTAQADLDALARDLIERFESPGPDPSLAPGDPGLFTDAGAAFNASSETGLSGRLTLNAAVDPSRGGAVWRLRDGLAATTPGDAGSARLLQDLESALTALRSAPVSGRFGSGQVSASGLASTLLSLVVGDTSRAEQSVSFAAASQTEMSRIELAGGVDTDAELQSLIQIEQAYAANARMIQIADEMMQTLLRL